MNLLTAAEPHRIIKNPTSTMRVSLRYAAIVFAGLMAAAVAGGRASAQAKATPPADVSAEQKFSQPDPSKRSEALYDFAMGHLNEVYFVNTNESSYANAALDFYKKAYALDPNSQVIGEHLAEMYYEAHRTHDAVIEAQGILQKDPGNLPVRKLLVRIYLRTLGNITESSVQQDSAVRAIEQLEQIRRLDPQDTESSLWLSRLYRLRGDSNKAESILKDLLERNPSDASVAEQEAQLMLDQSRAQEAATMLQGVVSRTPSARLLDLLGEAHEQLRDFSNSEKAYREAVDLEPEEPAHHRGLAQALAAQEKFAEALEQYQRLAALDPDDPDNYLQMAEMDRQLHRLDDAEKNIVQAKQRAPGNLEVVYSEAMIYEAQGRYDDAVKVLSSAVTNIKADTSAAPSHRRSLAVLYEQLGRLYRETEKYPAALNTFAELAALGDEEARRADLQIVDTYRAGHDLPHALEAAQKALKKYPQDRDLRVTQALLISDKGDPDQAASLLRALLTHTAEDFEIDLDLGQVYQQNRRYAEAEAAMAQAGQVATRDSDREMVWFMLGATLEREKKYDQAEEEFKRVLAVNPKNAPVLNYYGYMLADRGVRLSEATDLVKRALAEDPDNGSYLDSLGWAYYKQDKLAEAEDTLRQAAEKVHNDATVLEHLGDVYMKRGKSVQALAQWDHALAEWHRAVPADVEPERIAALEAKLSAVRQRIAQKPGGKDQPLEN